MESNIFSEQSLSNTLPNSLEYSNENYHVYSLIMGPNDESDIHQHLYNSLFICMSNVIYTEEIYNSDYELEESNEINEYFKTILPKEYSISQTIHRELTGANGGLYFLIVESLELYNNTEDPMPGSEQVFENFNVMSLYGNNDITALKNSIIIFFSIQKNNIISFA